MKLNQIKTKPQSTGEPPRHEVRRIEERERLQAFPSLELNAGLRQVGHPGHLGARLHQGFRLLFEESRDW